MIATELTDKICWLLARRQESFMEIRTLCIKLLMALICEDSIDRIVLNLKGRLKTLVVERDGNLVFSTLKLLHKILELDPSKRVLDFELVQNLVLNLDHTNTKIFSETTDLLSHNSILEDSNFLKVVFTADSMHRMIEMFPKTNDPPRINFCLLVIFEFTHDAKTAGTLMARGGTEFYTALYTNLLNGERKTKLVIMKILYQLLKFNSRSGPQELFPDWNVFVKFLNLNYKEIKDKEYEIFCQAVVTLLSLSKRPGFIDRVNCVEMFKNCFDGVSNKLYSKRDIEMKNIMLEILKNILYNEAANKADRLNGLFRNRSFNMVQLILMLFEPYYTTNENISEFGPSIFEFLTTLSETPLFKSVFNAKYDVNIAKLKDLHNACGNHLIHINHYITKIINSASSRPVSLLQSAATNKIDSSSDTSRNPAKQRLTEDVELLLHKNESSKPVHPDLQKLEELMAREKAEQDDIRKGESVSKKAGLRREYAERLAREAETREKLAAIEKDNQKVEIG